MSKIIPIPLSVSWSKSEISLPSGKQIEFPDKCVYCGSPREKFCKRLGFAMIKNLGNKTVRFRYNLKIPYCKKHSREANWNVFLITSSLFGMFFALLIIGFWPDLIFKSPIPILSGLIYIIGVAVITPFVNAGLIMALALVRKSLKNMVFAKIMNGNGDLGILIDLKDLAKPNESENYILRVIFTNEAYADEFEKLNTSQHSE
jgi:hypothetical protein